MNFAINPWVAIGVLASTAATDAAYVFFNAAVSSRRRVWAANWSSIWYMLSAFAVISYTENALYVAFAATIRHDASPTRPHAISCRLKGSPCSDTIEK
jgi:hypothetical protein